jgi:hypothetical protein
LREPVRIGGERSPRVEQSALGGACLGDDPRALRSAPLEVIELPEAVPEGRGAEYDSEWVDLALLVQLSKLERQLPLRACERDAGSRELGSKLLAFRSKSRRLAREVCVSGLSVVEAAIERIELEQRLMLPAPLGRDSLPCRLRGESGRHCDECGANGDRREPGSP